MQNMDRRTALALGAALIAPTASLSGPAKAEIYAKHDGLVVAPGVRRIDLGRWPASLPNYRAIAMTDYVVAPAARVPPEQIWRDTIFHILEGQVRVSKAKQFWVNAGGVFVSIKGESQEIENLDEIDAVMRVIALCKK